MPAWSRRMAGHWESDSHAERSAGCWSSSPALVVDRARATASTIPKFHEEPKESGTATPLQCRPSSPTWPSFVISASLAINKGLSLDSLQLAAFSALASELTACS
jgi:hypothetical protein